MATTMSTNVNNVYVNSIVTISLETGIDLVAETGNVYIDVKYPAGHTPATARLAATKNVTKIEYTTDDDTLDVAGNYFLQGIISVGGITDDTVGDTALLVVKARFK